MPSSTGNACLNGYVYNVGKQAPEDTVNRLATYVSDKDGYRQNPCLERGAKGFVPGSSWGEGGRRFESDHPDQKKKRAVNESIETSVNSFFHLAASRRLR